ncbi:MAG TPA: lipopolysaccharide biosynthesis protein, partial [Methylomirabilota bacterium]|nr:lipopolysaccharide biosynthesis protein [Methylomirabilota bacterium]
LTPADVGLVAMVTAVTGFAALFKDLGLSMATIQRDKITEEQISTLFWINVLTSGVLMLMLMALGPLLADFYREPRLVGITVALASLFVLGGLNAQHFALLRRQMRFVTVTAVEMTALVVGAAVGVGMAWMGAGYWALVGMPAASGLVSTVGAWVASGWRPGWPRRGVGARSLVKFGGRVLALDWLNYIACNADNFLVGRYWGSGPLGLYAKAYRMLELMTRQVNGAVGSVAVPALARLQGDPERLRRYFLNGYGFVLAVSTLVICSTAVFAGEIVAVLLGPQWTAVARLFVLFAPGALAVAIMNSQGWLAVALGRVERQVKLACWVVPVTVLAFAGGLPFGIEGVALAYSLVKVALIVPVTRVMTDGTCVSPRDIWGAAKYPLAAGAGALVAGVAVRHLLSPTWSPVVVLLLGGAVTAGTYLALLLGPFGQMRRCQTILRELTRPAGSRAAPMLS